MLKAILMPLLSLTAAAVWAAESGDGKVLVPADPAQDPPESEVLIRKDEVVEEKPAKKVIRKIRTVRKAQAAPESSSSAGTPVAGKSGVQVNTFNMYGAPGTDGQADSLAAELAAKSSRDSAALAESERRLAEERAMRSGMEGQLLTTGLLVLDAVYFETARTDISINSEPYLDMLAKMLVKYPKLRLEVAGHTDFVGTEAYNERLSRGRAEAVRAFLAEAEPSLAARLTARGYGESRPKADNNTAEGRKRNRRTELQVLNKEALEEYNRPPAQALGSVE